MLPFSYGRMLTLFYGCLKSAKCLNKVWVSRSKAGFCPVAKYWQFGCSEVCKIEQVKRSSQRQGCSPKNTPIFLIATLYAMACSVYRVSLHTTFVDQKNSFKITLQFFLDKAEIKNCSIIQGNCRCLSFTSRLTASTATSQFCNAVRD